jgi:hypothetical protein
MREHLDKVGAHLTYLESDFDDGEIPKDRADEARKAYDLAYDGFENLRTAYLHALDELDDANSDLEQQREENRTQDPKAKARALVFEAEGILLTGDATGALQYLLRALRTMETQHIEDNEVGRL